MSSASVSSVFGWEQFSAEKGYEGSRTYVYVTAASSQPKKPHDLFFFPFSLKLTACCLQTTNNNESSKAFSSICFHTHHFSLSFTMIMTLQQSSRACLASRTPCQPQQDLLSPGVLPYNRQSFLGTSDWEILSAAGAGTTQGIITPLFGLSSSFSSPHPRAERGICWQAASHRVETMGLPSLKELFIWSSTIFAQVQESSKLCVYFLCHCSQWFAVSKYGCAGSMDSPIIFIASFRKLLFPSKDYYCYSNYQLFFF